mmetsp:Transcript_93031/g.221193  ORF Transcript_93031/g.221193 Transcript_93031/m.221193 type:complete len:213 (+) Transcript_93031:494-1132(+)
MVITLKSVYMLCGSEPKYSSVFASAFTSFPNVCVTNIAGRYIITIKSSQAQASELSDATMPSTRYQRPLNSLSSRSTRTNRIIRAILKTTFRFWDWDVSESRKASTKSSNNENRTKSASKTFQGSNQKGRPSTNQRSASSTTKSWVKHTLAIYHPIPSTSPEQEIQDVSTPINKAFAMITMAANRLKYLWRTTGSSHKRALVQRLCWSCAAI